MAKKRNNEPIFLHVTMTLKKPFPINKNGFLISRRAKNIIIGIEDDYPELHLIDVTAAFTISDDIDCTFRIDPKFAKEHMYFDGKFAPERYMGAYLSRVARRLFRMHDQKWIARYFWDPGMFKYKYIVLK